jgi:hypothetical protein
MKKVSVAYNDCYGGFSLSDEGYALYCELKGIKQEDYPSFPRRDNCRHDKVLIKVIKKLGDKANGRYAKLAISKGNGQYRIDEYDGSEIVVWRSESEDEWITPDE